MLRARLGQLSAAGCSSPNVYSEKVTDAPAGRRQPAGALRGRRCDLCARGPDGVDWSAWQRSRSRCDGSLDDLDALKRLRAIVHAIIYASMRLASIHPLELTERLVKIDRRIAVIEHRSLFNPEGRDFVNT